MLSTFLYGMLAAEVMIRMQQQLTKLILTNYSGLAPFREQLAGWIDSGRPACGMAPSLPRRQGHDRDDE